MWDGRGGQSWSAWMIASSAWRSPRTHHLHRGSFLAISPPDVKIIKWIWLELLGDSFFSVFSFIFLSAPSCNHHFYFLLSHKLEPNSYWICSSIKVQRRCPVNSQSLCWVQSCFPRGPPAFWGEPCPVTGCSFPPIIQQSSSPGLRKDLKAGLENAPQIKRSIDTVD